MIHFSEKDSAKVIERYTKRFEEYGYSQKAVGWGEKGRQEIRFEILASQWDFEGKEVLDIGAGFGDLYRYLKPLRIQSYTGIELVSVLVKKGNELYGQNQDFKLIAGNFLEIKDSISNHDIALISGLFNFKLVEGNNYDFIGEVLAEALKICRVGVAANFVTDRVDYHEELIFNAKPEKILEMGLNLTKNVILRNDYFPFEFSIFLNKDDSFDKSDTIFKSYKKINGR